MPPYHPAIIKSETLLSSWIFYLAVVYCIAKYYATSSSVYDFLQTYANPTFSILIALSYQTYAFIKIVMDVRPFNRMPIVLVKFFILTFIFKLLPLYLVVGVPPLNKLPSKIYEQALTGVPVFIAIFLFYFAYITQQNLDIFEIYMDLNESYIKDDNRIIVYRWASNIYNIVMMQK